eukprot:SAG11_NODE_24062_length_378_cov_2.465950_1_plen_22_part_01
MKALFFTAILILFFSYLVDALY